MSGETIGSFRNETNASSADVLNQTTNGGTYTENDPEFIFFTFILHGIITNTVGFIGLIGNIICILVLRRPQMRGNSTNVILTALSAFDAFLIVTSMLMLGFPAIGRYSKDVISLHYYTQIYPYIMPCVYAFGLVAQTGSIYCTLGVTVERYIVICWPLRSSNICTYGRAKVAVVLIALFSLIYNIPRFFEVTWGDPAGDEAESSSMSNASFIGSNSTYRINGSYEFQIFSNSSNNGSYGEESQSVIPLPTSLRLNSTYISVYVTWMYFVFMFALPFGCLSVLNLLIYLDVRRSNARLATLSQDERKELRLAVMLMTVVVVFQICNLPPLICNILEVVYEDVEAEFAVWPFLTQTANLLVTVNSSVNIFIYMTFNNIFKRVFLQCLSDNFSCCYGSEGSDAIGYGDEKICCPLIKCGRKSQTGHRNNGAITGTTDFYMTDALMTQPSTLTTYVNASKPHSTRPSLSGLHPSNLHDTHSNMSTSIVSCETSSNSPFRPPDNRLAPENVSNDTSHFTNGKSNSLAIPAHSHKGQISSPKNSLVTTNTLQGIHNEAIEIDLQLNKNNNDVPKLVLEEDGDMNFPPNDSGSKAQLLDEKNPSTSSKTSQPFEDDMTMITYGLAPKASSETLETLSSNPSPAPLRSRRNVDSHGKIKNTSDTTNTCSKPIPDGDIDMIGQDTSNDVMANVINGTNKHSLLNKNLKTESGVDIKANGSTGVDNERKILNEKTPFLHHIDSEDQNDNMDDLNQNYSTLASDVIAKISDSQMISKNFRDV